MKVTPISDATARKQANPFVWPKGPVDFEVLSAIGKDSKAGNAMSELKLRVTNTEGKTKLLDDWLVASDATAYKVRHFADATGMLAQYEKGELDERDMVGRTGQLMLGIKRGEPDGQGGTYPDKNKVLDYVAAAVGAQPPKATAPASPDDEIPF